MRRSAENESEVERNKKSSSSYSFVAFFQIEIKHIFSVAIHPVGIIFTKCFQHQKVPLKSSHEFLIDQR